MATPGEVMDAIIAETCSPSDAIQMFDKLMECLRPEPDAARHLPLSTLEVERLRVALRTISDALDVAQSRKPAHFYLVRGGR